MDRQRLITTDRIIELHAKGLQEVGQDPLPTRAEQRRCVEARLGNAQLADQYSSRNISNVHRGLCFAGYLMFYLVNGHCFLDGNKRIGWIAAMTVLAGLGLTIQSTEEEAIHLVQRIASNDIADGRDVVRWLAEHLQSPIPDP